MREDLLLVGGEDHHLRIFFPQHEFECHYQCLRRHVFVKVATSTDLESHQNKMGVACAADGYDARNSYSSLNSLRNLVS